ncbi:hypothetical protein SCLCIDRAFT_118232 [Scleroderma citrinum Foug A]|uniref:Uncharacterized protein n=1 Tax=Scleroderma citrinum Foug A TaxID=1036808 RepID=A0A0C3DR57_9AGAM|nr:hypothetical protein SCLCIDRAFT_118232 [Scleroderma citrinum Foug A]
MTEDVHKQNPAVDAAHNRSTIRVLWDFDVKLFQMVHCAELLAENERLECLNSNTLREWKEAGCDSRGSCHSRLNAEKANLDVSCGQIPACFRQQRTEASVQLSVFKSDTKSLLRGNCW